MSPIENRYRTFCERMADEFEAEAKLYEEDPNLHDGDHQFIASLRQTCHEWRQKLWRMEAAHPDQAAWPAIRSI